jgi:hypothetical protein
MLTWIFGVERTWIHVLEVKETCDKIGFKDIRAVFI